jgi:hypothetical protein
MEPQYTDVIAVFDAGRSWKRFLLFDRNLQTVHTEEKIIVETAGSEGLPAYDFPAIEQWMMTCISRVISGDIYNIRAMNIAAGDDCLAELEKTLTKITESVTSGKSVFKGRGISSTAASLVPYLKGSEKPFILVSTGTFCTFMNPYETNPAAGEQRTRGRKISSSRFPLGKIHDRNVILLDDHFGVTGELYKTIKIKHKKVAKMEANRRGRVFFRHGVPEDMADTTADLSHFLTYADAYHQMMYDLVDECLEAYRQTVPEDADTEIVYVTGGFARNDTFVRILAGRIPEKRVYASTIEHATALGAAIEVYKEAFGAELPPLWLGLKAIMLRDE